MANPEYRARKLAAAARWRARHKNEPLVIERRRESSRQWYKKKVRDTAYRARKAEGMRRYRAKDENVLKVAARELVAWAVKNGRLVAEPCEACGSTVRVQAHHADYLKPLEVRWLCRPCHQRQHTGLSEDRAL